MKDSTFVHGNEGESADPYTGQTEIHKRIVELDFKDCKVLVSNVDSQPSLNGGIMIQVIGEMSNNNTPSSKFAQTFFLSTQASGFYVLNDMFRFLKEDVDTLYEKTRDPIPAVDSVKVESQSVKENVNVAKDIIEPIKTEVFQKVDPKVEQSVVEVKAPQPSVSPIQQLNGNPAALTPQSNQSPVLALSNSRPIPVQPIGSPVKVQVKAAQVPIQVVPSPVESLKNTSTVQQPTQPIVDASSKTIQQIEQPIINAATKPTPVSSKSVENSSKKAAQQSTQSTNAKIKTSQQSTKPVTSSQSTEEVKKDTTETKTDVVEEVKEAIVEPPKPSTWASRAASATTKPTTTPTLPIRPKSLPEPQPTQQTQPQPHVIFQSDTPSEDREKFSCYVKNLAPGTTEHHLKQAFVYIGSIKRVEILHDKNCAFVEFLVSEVCFVAIGQSAVVNGKMLVLEERLKRLGKGNWQGNGQGQGNGSYKDKDRKFKDKKKEFGKEFKDGKRV